MDEKYEIAIMVDTNDGDYVTEISEIDLEDLEKLRTLFSVKRPVLALSIIMVVLIIAVSITQFLPFHKQSDTQDVVNVYLAEQIKYIAYLDENSEFDTNYGTGIEEYFLSEGNF